MQLSPMHLKGSFGLLQDKKSVIGHAGEELIEHCSIKKYMLSHSFGLIAMISTHLF